VILQGLSLVTRVTGGFLVGGAAIVTIGGRVSRLKAICPERRIDP
jgi:hypothetical protein